MRNRTDRGPDPSECGIGLSPLVRDQRERDRRELDWRRQYDQSLVAPKRLQAFRGDCENEVGPDNCIWRDASVREHQRHPATESCRVNGLINLCRCLTMNGDQRMGAGEIGIQVNPVGQWRKSSAIYKADILVRKQ